MQLHQLVPKHKSKKKKRVGRGGKRGTYSGKGIKGQKSRAGRKMVPVIRELIKRYPKLRGYRFKGRRLVVVTVNIDKLEKVFPKGAVITPRTLIERNLISKMKGRIPKVKILGKGKLTKALNVQKCDVSKTAKEAIEKVGGSVKK